MQTIVLHDDDRGKLVPAPSWKMYLWDSIYKLCSGIGWFVRAWYTSYHYMPGVKTTVYYNSLKSYNNMLQIQ